MSAEVIRFYQPATPIRVIAVYPEAPAVVHEVPVLACYYSPGDESQEDGFMVLDDRDSVPVRLEQSCWVDAGARLIVGPADSPPDWWDARIAQAVGGKVGQ